MNTRPKRIGSSFCLKPHIKAHTRTMQTSVIFAAAPSFPLASTNKSPGSPWKFKPRPQSSRFPLLKAHADPSEVDYSSMTSVFPAEACETLGGEACNVEMYPEVKLKPEPRSTNPTTSSELVDREYYEYDSPKTVFLGEACDDLGGEFCEAEFQKGVH
ncbi:light-regulated protein, chloroplastic [Rhodamnia argentea]|uniref:Light-regulated protein, chloroplastic n=1 Tax=Rhodamnia argentea TaxID=178133 RepID=A0A8B8PZ77_9MYRT|nr:light-regulated protein, chloroplastic [Rhodamnia argentea]